MEKISRTSLFRVQAPPGLQPSRSALPLDEPKDVLESAPSSPGLSWGTGLALAGMGILSVAVSGCGSEPPQRHQQQQASRTPADQVRSLARQGQFFRYGQFREVGKFWLSSTSGYISESNLSRGEAQKAIEAGEPIYFRNGRSRELGTVRNLEDLRGLAGDGEKLSLAQATGLDQLRRLALFQVDDDPITLAQAQDRLARGQEITANQRYGAFTIRLQRPEDIDAALNLARASGRLSPQNQ